MDRSFVEHCVTQLLRSLGQDLNSPHMKDTPKRVAAFYEEFLFPDEAKLETSFGYDTFEIDQVVGLRGIQLYSMCAHHGLPFTCNLSAAYIPDGKVIGISKIARIAVKHASAFTVQEELVRGVADELSERTESSSVAVYGVGLHFCMAMRGVKMPAEMFTSDLRGDFREEGPARAEFFSIVRGQHGK